MALSLPEGPGGGCTCTWEPRRSEIALESRQGTWEEELCRKVSKDVRVCRLGDKSARVKRHELPEVGQQQVPKQQGARRSGRGE